ncbi:5'-nucleotidase C-terminal domain-containing protein [Halanaerobium praevalens]|uniref:5'-nucleotidase C-terminal domain-containing protein n=1 Tax=Halanaerobium praevalens TaxID=2331 RepID=UPI0002EDBB46|nr:5'-nucleotidase C-terminal domain-containing protein [Halanaerobium praevalens]
MKKLIICLVFLTILTANTISAAAAVDKKIELNGESINLEDDEQIMKLKEEIEKKSEKEKDMIIGSTVIFLNGQENHIRNSESNLGCLITDAVLAKTKAEAVIINSRTINASIAKGLISMRDIKRALPAQDEIIIKEIKGSKLVEVLEHSISKYPENASFFPQLSGIKIIFAEIEGAANKILKVLVNSKPLKENKYYLIATNDSLAQGGDGFKKLAQAKKIKNSGRLDQIFKEYLQEKEIIEKVKANRIIAVSKVGNNYFYRIQKGDYLYLIANKFSVSVKKIMQANNLKNISLIYEGQKLIIPGLR